MMPLYIWMASFAVFQAAFADDILCERAPTAVVVGQKKPYHFESASPAPCAEASAKIQAIAYECGNPNDTYRKTEDFLKGNIKDAERKCEEFCKEVDPSCRGVLNHPSACGLSIPTSKALAVGHDIVKCPKHCSGQAFTFCSLYHANFFSYDPDLFKDSEPNCVCERMTAREKANEEKKHSNFIYKFFGIE